MNESPSVFVLGSNEPRVTIYSQQCRALNLAWALHETGQIAPEAKIAVIGGGIAGVTFGAAAGRLGAQVVLLEQASRVLQAQAGSHLRWIHPHIYDWPRPGWSDPRAGLPLMDWTAGPAGEVVASLRTEWSQASTAFGVESEFNVQLQDLDLAGDRPRIMWNSPGFHAEIFDLVVLALGYGQEGTTPFSTSYWHDDDLHQNVEGTTLVSGTGDGGLIDVVRACLVDFEQSELIQLIDGDWIEPHRDSLIALEDGNPAPEVVTEFYLNELVVPQIEQFVTERSGDRLRHVMLNGRRNVPLDNQSAPLNRVIVAHLLRGGLAYRSGELRVSSSEPRNLTVQLTSGGNTEDVSVARLVLRHGPTNRPIDHVQITPKLSPATARSLSVSTDRDSASSLGCRYLRGRRG